MRLKHIRIIGWVIVAFMAYRLIFFVIGGVFDIIGFLIGVGLPLALGLFLALRPGVLFRNMPE
jgi:hypothetical protein